MGKAEEKSLKEYPQNIVTDYNGSHDLNYYKRVLYQQGYNQAEKDLEMTWEDIKIILDKEDDILSECNSHKELVIETYPKGEDYYGEILKRFKDSKKCQIGNTE